MKQIVTVTMAVIMLFMTAGCSNSKTAQIKESNKISKEQEENADNITESKTEESNGEIQLTTLTDGNSDGCSNENGYYYINKADNCKLKNGNYAYHLMYMDYTAKKEVYLCSNAGCKHDTEECTSVVSGEMDDPVIFWYNNYLYLLDRACDQEGTTSSGFSIGEEGETEWGIDIGTQEYPTALYRMNPDGSDRKKVHAFESKITLDSYIISDGTNLYFIKKVLKNEKADQGLSYNTVAEKKLIQLNMTSGEEQEVCDLDIGEKNSDSWNIIGCHGSNIVVQGFVYDHELTDEERRKDMEDRDYSMDMIKKSKTELGIINIYSGEFKKLYSFSNKLASSSAQVNQYLYVSTDDSDEIKKFDLETGGESVFTKLKANSITHDYNNVLYCTGWDSFEKYFINLETGEAQKFTLKTKTAGFAPEIMAETEDMYLVIYDYEATRDTVDAEAWNITKNKFALIKKEDFYNNKENWMPIEMITSGGAEEC